MAPPRNPRNSPSEQTDEAPGLIESEEVEIERDIPAEDAAGRAYRAARAAGAAGLRGVKVPHVPVARHL